jgi:hypothetical protein
MKSAKLTEGEVKMLGALAAAPKEVPAKRVGPQALAWGLIADDLAARKLIRLEREGDLERATITDAGRRALLSQTTGA